MSIHFAGNTETVQFFQKAITDNNIFHAFLISGPHGSGKKHLAREIAAAVECTGSSDFPCRICPQCQKVLHNIHPDVTVFESMEKKALTLDEVRKQIVNDSYILPNEGKKKVYIIPNADQLSVLSQNALLLTLEDPRPYNVFILLSENPDRILPTLRSRLMEFSLKPVALEDAIPFLKEDFPNLSLSSYQRLYENSGGYIGPMIESAGNQENVNADKVAHLVSLLQGCQEVELLSFCFSLENMTRPDFLIFLKDVIDTISNDILNSSQNNPAKSYQAIKYYQLLNELYQDGQANVNTAHLCGRLCAESIKIMKEGQ